jgi:hypothetical protein
MVEIVEAYGLCPWAKPARLGGEVAVEVLWGTPTVDAWAAAASDLLGRNETRVAMVVAPELDASPATLRAVRDQIGTRIPTAGVAHFHPDSPLDAATAPRIVPYLRRSPDPLLQLVPLSLLDSVRGAATEITRADQLKMLGNKAPPHRGDVADQIAVDNHARVVAAADEVAARLAEIAADRRAAYARAGITVRTGL